MYYIDFGEKLFLKHLYNIELSENQAKELAEKVAEWKNGFHKMLNEKYIQKHIIFSFQLFDAWFHELCRTNIIYGQNIQAVCYNRAEPTEICFEIDNTVVNRYYEIIKKYTDIFNSEEFCLDEDDYYDGYEYRIFLCSENYGYYFPCSNLYFHRNGDYTQDKIIISALNEIFALLKSIGIEERYYMMCR